MKKAIILARVSTSRQEKEGMSIEKIQLPALRDYCKDNDLEIVREFKFSESTGNKIRSKFDEVVTFFRKNKDVKALVAFRVDRVTRNIRDMVDVKDLVELHGKEVHLVSERKILNKDTRGLDKFLINSDVTNSEYQLDKARDQALDIQRNKLNSGELPRKAPYGYINIKLGPKEKSVVPDPYKSLVVKKLYEWRGLGPYSLKTLEIFAKDMFGEIAPKAASIDKILKDPFYSGTMRSNIGLYPHKYERLITKDEFQRIQEVIKGFNRKPSKYRSNNAPYRSLITCSVCGCVITPEPPKKDKYVYYHCTQSKGKHENVAWVRIEEINRQFSELFKAIQIPEEKMPELIADFQKDSDDRNKFTRELREKYSRDIVIMTNRLSKMYNEHLDGSITDDDYKQKREEFINERQVSKDKLEKLDQEDEDYYLTSTYLLDLASRASEIFESSDCEQKDLLLHSVLQNCYLEGDKLRYELKNPLQSIFKFAPQLEWCPRRDSNSRP